MSSITAYSEPARFQPAATTRVFEARGLDYEVIDLTEDDAAMSQVSALGYREVAVVIAGEKHWAVSDRT